MFEKTLLDQKEILEEKLKQLEPFSSRSQKKYQKFKREYQEVKKKLKQIKKQISLKTENNAINDTAKEKRKKIVMDLLKKRYDSKKFQEPSSDKEQQIKSKYKISSPISIQHPTIPMQYELEQVISNWNPKKSGARSKHEWDDPEILWKSFVDGSRFKYESTLPTRYSIQIKQRCKQCGAERYKRVYYTKYRSNPKWHWELNKGNSRIVYNSVKTRKKMYDDINSRYMGMLTKLLEETNNSFDNVIPSGLSKKLGVYIICDKTTKEVIYAGRSKNLRRRLLGDHRRGNIDGSQFRKALGRSIGTANEEEISEYIRKNCTYQFLKLDNFEEAVRLEHFITAIIGPVLNTKLRQ